MDTLLHDLNLFYEMLNCCHDLPVYQYDENMTFQNKVPNALSDLYTLFSIEDMETFVTSFAQKHHCPLITSNELGITWIIAFKKEDAKLRGIFFLGPFFMNDFSPQAIRIKLQKKGISLSLCSKLMDTFRNMPIISHTKFLEYAIMFHYCVNHEKIHIHDIHFRNNSEPAILAESSVDAHGTWAAEQAMLQMVTDGNLNYQRKMTLLATSGTPGKLSNGDSLRQAKNGIIIFISLCCRAAIRGGLNIELSYTLADRYIQNVEAANSLTECKEINSAMLEDYINRVHKYKLSKISAPVKSVCDYIDLNLEKNPSLDKIADFANYSKYYLTKKFKQETGKTITDYMNELKIKRAKELLLSTNLDIQTIGEQLGFCSPSYFSECFRKYTGQTPAEYRCALND